MPPPSVPLAAIRQPAFLYDADGRIVEANDLAEALAGRPLVGSSCADVARIFRHRHPDGTPLAPEELPACRALAGGEVVDVPFTITIADDRALEILATGAPIRDGDAVAGALVVWQDVTERTHIEDKLRKALGEQRGLAADLALERSQLQAVIENMEEATGIWSTAGDLILINDATVRLYGFETKEQMLKHLSEYADVIVRTLDGRDLPQEEWPPSRVLRGETFANWELEQFIPSINKRFIGSNSGSPVRDENGTIVLGVVTVHDVTALHDARRAAEESRAELETALEAAASDLAALVRMHDLSGRLLEADGIRPLLDEIMETAVAIMGAEKGTLQLVEGGSLRIVASSSHDEPFLSFFASAESQASACGVAMAERSRVVVPDVDGSPLFAGTPSLSVLREAGVRAVQSTPLVSRSCELMGVLTTHWGAPYTPDEHDLWRLDLLARQAADLIERARAEAALRTYAENLQRSNEDLERFAYVSSHDLQEPLRAIVSFSQLLERRYKGQLGEDADDYIEFIVEGGLRMQSLIKDLLAYSRVNTTQQQLHPTDVEDVMAAVELHLEVQLREGEAALTHDPLPTVLADPLQLEQVLANLISNAIKFRRPDEPLRIHIGACRINGFWEFAVSDNGIGIEAEYLDRIFVIFQRLHTKDAYPGTGIGLAIVKRIIDRHGGTIRVESTPGEGSTFFFTLPAA